MMDGWAKQRCFGRLQPSAPALYHARDLARARDRALDLSHALARALDLAIDHARDLVRDLDRAIDRALDIDRVRALDRDRALDHDSDSAGVRDLASDRDLARDFAIDFVRARYHARYFIRDLAHTSDVIRDLGLASDLYADRRALANAVASDDRDLKLPFDIGEIRALLPYGPNEGDSVSGRRKWLLARLLDVLTAETDRFAARRAWRNCAICLLDMARPNLNGKSLDELAPLEFTLRLLLARGTGEVQPYEGILLVRDRNAP